MTREIDFHTPAEDQAQLDKITIQDNGEPLVDFVGLSPKLVAAPKRPFFEFPMVHLVRQSIAEMLVKAAEALPDGIRLSVVEGYRPINIQRAMYQYAFDRVKKEHPAWNDKQLHRETGRRSAPIDTITPPPHITGGAVDIDLINNNNESLDMTSPFHIQDWQQAKLHAPDLSSIAHANRKILEDAFKDSGLTNYADEWWHWSYGDSGWALRTGAPYAIYDRIELPADAHWVGDMSKLPPEDIETK